MSPAPNPAPAAAPAVDLVKNTMDDPVFVMAAIYGLALDAPPVVGADARTKDYKCGTDLRIGLRFVVPITGWDTDPYVVYHLGTPPMLPKKWSPGLLYVVRALATGSFVTAGLLPREATLEYDIYVDRALLVGANALPLPPEPTGNTLIPRDSPRVLLGVGYTDPNNLNDGNKVLYEQYWRRSPSWYSLAPGQQKRVVFEQVNGVTESSSESKDVATNLGLSASAGWGAISATLSATLSFSQESSHSRTLQSQTTSSVEDVVNNAGKVPAMVVQWQLIDSYVLVDKTSKVLVTVESAQAPSVVRVYPSTATLILPDGNLKPQ